ncbi:MAG: phosphohistidine phosphatase SixA [Bacteroidetes bacterium]|nr:MAG: phosphohistidine phosphatase SixA [Bacteroidota bacterium]
MKLYFLRHGEASNRAATDADRELTELGAADAVRAGAFLAAKRIVLTRVLTSPLLRAQQTADRVLSSLGPVPREVTEHLVPSSDPRNLYHLLRSFTNESRILLVTHEPFVSRCIAELISGSEAAQVQMKPATLAYVETDGVPGRGNGRLKWLVRPDILTMMR